MKKNILLSTGGTGGHILPALSILEHLKENFNLEIMSPLTFANQETVESITLKLNRVLEKMIRRNPHQWIWSHNRWK